MRRIVIDSMERLELAAVSMGVLPFFANNITGFSVEEMAAPGMLFGLTDDSYGCWEWKGPVIQRQTTAYGKFFNRKAGFVSVDLLPDFLNYRRHKYPVKPHSTESMILELIRANEGLTSTHLKSLVFGDVRPRQRKPDDLVDLMESRPAKRKSLEGPLQRLQMGGWLNIADFEYKYTAAGRRYGWGVALYTTPEMWFERSFDNPDGSTAATPETSFHRLVETVASRLEKAGISADTDSIECLIR